jgi:hypothetical protein
MSLLKIVMWFAKPAVNRSLNKMADDPEMAKAIKDMNFHRKEVERLAKEAEEEFGMQI